MPAERRLNDATEGFGLKYESGGYTPTTLESLNNSPFILPNSSKVVSFPLLCGLMNQSKKLPLRFLQGLQIELEVVNNYADICLQRVETAGTSLGVGAVGEQDNTSTTWAISEAVIQMDTITLDSQLDNEYTDHLMSGKNIPIPFVSFVHQIQSMLYNKNPVASLSRAFTRLEIAFL